MLHRVKKNKKDRSSQHYEFSLSKDQVATNTGAAAIGTATTCTLLDEQIAARENNQVADDYAVVNDGDGTANNNGPVNNNYNEEVAANDNGQDWQ